MLPPRCCVINDLKPDTIPDSLHHQLLTDPPAVPQGAHLRHLRHTAGVTITDAAQAINAHTNRLSELERGTRHNHDLATRYHNWLTQTAA